MGVFKRYAAFRKKVDTKAEAKPVNADTARLTPRLKELHQDEQKMVAIYPGDEVMWRHPQGYCFVVQVVEVYPDVMVIRVMRNGEPRQIRVSPRTLGMTPAQARMSARRRAISQMRLLPNPTTALAVGKTVRWLREGTDPVMARVIEVHWSDTQAKICPIGQRLTCWVDVPTLEVVA